MSAPMRLAPVANSNVRMVYNASYERRLGDMFPGFHATAKHNPYRDFGFPEQLTFKQFYDAYERNGFAAAGIDKTIAKTWQTTPFLQEEQRDGSQAGSSKETKREREIRQRFEDLRLWQHLAEADRRSMVGTYAGLILRFADSQPFSAPVGTVPGLAALVEVIPAWEAQLAVSEWDYREGSETYGQPLMFQFNEAAVSTERSQPRSFQVHPDRVIIWSKDGTVNGRSALKPGFNDLITLEKVIGAGGEGFWKNAKSAPILEVDKDASIDVMARAMGVPASEVRDLMAAQVQDWQSGFDDLLMTQGMTAKTLGITLPSPEHFVAAALQSYAASMSIPLKILVGNQTGERASTEDAQDWAQTNMGRRNGFVRPNIMGLVRRLERVGVLPERDWHLEWADLTEASVGEKIDRAAKMAGINQTMKDSGELIFTPEEIRGVVDYEPLSEGEKYREDEGEDLAEGGGRAADLPFTGNARKRKGRTGAPRKGYNPSQPRGGDGKWVDTGAGGEKSLPAFLKALKKDPGRHMTGLVGPVRNGPAIQAQGGPDATGWRRIVETSEINHALKGHGRGSKKWDNGDRLTKADLGMIDRIVGAGTPNVVLKKGGDLRVSYRVRLDGRTYNYIETVSRSRSALIFKTMWWRE